MNIIELDSFLRALVFVLGAMVGSFLNVCIVRMPHNRSVVFPSSHCPACKASIRWYDNLPLISFCLLQGRCRACRQAISPRYFLVELMTALLFLGAYLRLSYNGLPVLIPAFTLIGLLIVASFIDLEWRIIPDEVSVGGMGAGIVLSLIVPALHHGPALEVLVLGQLIAFILVGVCLSLQALKVLRRKASFEDEDKVVILIGTTFLALQWAALTFARVLPWGESQWLALCDSLQGALIGACSLWVTGLIGEIFISKRVVTDYDFKTMVDDPAALMAELKDNGYVDHRGDLQASFRAVKSAPEMTLSPRFEKDRNDIYDMLRAVDDGGVMGWGDVKFLAMAGAFLGWQLALLSFFIAPFFGAVYGIFKLLRKQDTAIAYGPFLAMGILVSLFWGERILFWITSPGAPLSGLSMGGDLIRNFFGPGLV